MKANEPECAESLGIERLYAQAVGIFLEMGCEFLLQLPDAAGIRFAGEDGALQSQKAGLLAELHG